MKNGYDNFFKTAKKVRKGEPGPHKTARPKIRKNPPPSSAGGDIKFSEEELRAMFKVAGQKTGKRRKKDPVPFPWVAMSLSLVALVASGLYILYPEYVENLWEKVEIRATTAAVAAEGEEKKSESKGQTEAKASPEEKSGAASDASVKVSQDTSYFSKLTERKKELDAREKELNELEEELHRQRAEIEVQIKRLDEMRRQIASVLNERVQMDEERVNKLVEVYSNMKPKQAAEIIETINEDLAVEVLGRMKKKDAAEILNLIEAKKAQTLSEKYTGYKTR